jgi:hypothetical protein
MPVRCHLCTPSVPLDEWPSSTARCRLRRAGPSHCPTNLQQYRSMGARSSADLSNDWVKIRIRATVRCLHETQLMNESAHGNQANECPGHKREDRSAACFNERPCPLDKMTPHFFVSDQECHCRTDHARGGQAERKSTNRCCHSPGINVIYRRRGGYDDERAATRKLSAGVRGPRALATAI